jgi:glycosyltransferase involved in cell wall biosynthesis
MSGRKPMTDVTAVILTKNEEKNLIDCLESLKGFAKRTVVVDCGSEDGTCSIAEQYGADVYFHPFENYSKQFNWALDNTDITTKWTYRLDADERLTPALKEELAALALEHADDDINGFSTEAWLVFLGRVLKHGAANKRRIVMFKTGIGRIEDRRMDEHTVLSEGKSISCKERFIHEDFKDMTHWINKMNWYATREMQDYFEFKEGKSAEIENDRYVAETRRKKFGFYYKLPMFSRSWFLFVYYYIFKGGFLDGRPGYIFNYMYHRWYRNLVDTKIYEQMLNPKPFEETGDLKQ